MRSHVLLEAVDKPHNLSAIFAQRDAVGVLGSPCGESAGRSRRFNQASLGSEKWAGGAPHATVEEAATAAAGGFGSTAPILGTGTYVNAVDYRQCDFTGTKPAVSCSGREVGA